ncbi:MAG: gluconolactonase, partial [Glaciecola sp.]
MDVIATGFVGAEGPIVLPDGAYALTDNDGVSRVGSDALVTTLATTGGDPNGLVLAADGCILVANNGLVCRPGKVPGTIQSIAPDGSVRELAGGLDAPNDIAISPDGRVWFTDSVVCILDETDSRPGRIHRFDHGRAEVIHEGLAFPNGLAFRTDGSLIVTETKTGDLHVVDDNGARQWVRMPTGAPDGLTFAADGTGFVCCFDVGIVYVLNPRGDVVDELHTGSDTWPTNCVLDGMGRLIVTEMKTGQLLAFDVGCKPQSTP